uniref:Phospholipid scramblase n=1 Tax=Macrostomum lignano TaxID=282301 RepID=A0A1I8IEZ1_9PLAT
MQQQTTPDAYAYNAQQQQVQQQALQMPPALQYLASLDQILIKQQKEMIENSSTCDRQCLGAQRPFEMLVTDNTGQEVIHISRPYKCMCYGQCFSCAKCCLDKVTVEAPPGRMVGTVTQVYEGCSANYTIQDAQGNTVLLIRGPSYCACHCPGDDIPFALMTTDGNNEIGKVSRQWSNLLQEYFTDADNFGITFPMDLHVDIKATILGACFLIDFMYFERSGNEH